MNIEVKDLIGGKISREGLEKEAILRRDQKSLLNEEPKSMTKEEWIERLEDWREGDWQEARRVEIRGYGNGFNAGIALMIDRLLHYLIDRKESRHYLEKLVDKWLEEEIEGSRKEGDSSSWHFGRSVALCLIQHELKGVTDF